MERPAYVLVDTQVLPEIFIKVLDAKRILAQGKAASLSDAAKMVGISRSAFYKYKDSVFVHEREDGKKIVNFFVELKDMPGVLANVISKLYQSGANILTINQNIPVEGVAPVSISASIGNLDITEKDLNQRLKALDGVVSCKVISNR